MNSKGDEAENRRNGTSKRVDQKLDGVEIVEREQRIEVIHVSRIQNTCLYIIILLPVYCQVTQITDQKTHHPKIRKKCI